MKFKITGLFLMLICAVVTVEAQLYRPFESFRVIRTEKFDIIYPKKSEPSARLLASYADNVYKEISTLFGINVPGRIPVTFAPHTDMFNGYYRPIPSTAIELYDTAMDLEWTTFEDNLKGLFVHELVHAVTMSTRKPFYRVMQLIFGNWATPALWNAPLFMIEGAAISMESLGGFGRSNDPLVRQKLRQAIHENRFHSPFQASGVYDSPGQSGIFYEYGGLFSAWLQQQYGMEKYAELWQAMGGYGHSSFFVYRSGFYRIFRRVYNMNFLDAWNTFRDSLALGDMEENQDEILPVRYRFFSENRNSFSAIASGGNDVYILNGTQEKIHIYNTQTENIRTINTGLFYSSDIDVSACGTTLLVSGYHVTGQRFRAVVIEQHTGSGRRTGRTFQGLYKARYFRDGVIGIQTELHNNSIVYRDFNGNTEILFRGNESLMFSGPQAVDSERIVFIAARNGERELMLYNYVTGELFRIENSADDNEVWRYMRGLNVSEGRLLFSHNINDRMYKLASVDLETMQAVLSNRDFSGGVLNPVSADGNIYYRANFFSGNGIMRFPETMPDLSGTQFSIKLAVPAAEDYGLTAAVNTQDLNAQSVSDNAFPVMESRPYFSIRYMNPFRFWFPLPLIRLNDAENFNISLDGGGIFSLIADPADRHFVMLVAYADIAYRMAMIDSFTWQTTITGFPIRLDFSDAVMVSDEDIAYRQTRVNLSASFSRMPGRFSYGFSLAGGYIRNAIDDGGASAYQWAQTASLFYYSAQLSFSNIIRRQHELYGNGLSLGIRGINILNDFQPRFEGRFRASVEGRIPFNFVFYGAYDKLGMNIHGSSHAYSESIFHNSASVEYTPHSGLNLFWIGGAEITAGLFSVEIQRSLSHLYFNRFYGALSLRNVLYDSGGHPNAEGIGIGGLHLAQSLVFKLELVSSIIPLKMTPFYLAPNIWGSWKFSNTITGKGKQWHIGGGFNFLY